MKVNTIISFLLIIMANNTTVGQDPSADSTGKSVILFVCEHGAARSTIAAAYFNKMAGERKLNYRAVFRGTDPDTILIPGAKNGLVQDGFKIDGWRPQPVTPEDITNASEIVTFDCVLPSKQHASKTIYQWNGIPPISKSYEVARDQIIAQVTALIESLEKRMQGNK